MKVLGLVILICMPIMLLAIIDFNSEYIGLGQPGEWHKTSETSNSYVYGSEGTTTTHVYYYYNPYNNTQIDSVYHYYSGPVASGSSIDRYFYTNLPAYRELLIETWSSDSWTPIPYLSQTTTYRYDYYGNKIYWCNNSTDSRIRIVWTYDGSNNCLSEMEYLDSYHLTNPYQCLTYTYDDQNRNIGMDYTYQNTLYYHKTKTWTNHSLPDSTYHQNFLTQPSIQYVVNGFDELGFHNYTKIMSYDGPPATPWLRQDYSYDLVYAHEMAFPSQLIYRSGMLTSPQADFVPTTTTTTEYSYSNDFHSVSFYDYQNETYHYNDAWYMTSHSYHGDTGIFSDVLTWNYYGVDNSDECLVPSEALFCYPNPAQGAVYIRLDQPRADPSIKAKVYNLRGQLIRELRASEIMRDELRYQWDCRDDADRFVPNGVYFIRTDGKSGSQYRKVTIVN